MPSVPQTAPSAAALLARLAADRAASAIFFDVDGTLAPIVARPEDAEVPRAARALLQSLAASYGLVGCVSGRPALDARRLVGLDDLTYVGNHGFERLVPGAEAPAPDPRLRDHVDTARSFIERTGRERIEAAGLRLEDKGAIQALHWRGAASESDAEAAAQAIAAEAKAMRRLVMHRGRKVIELRPPVAINKGTALMTLLEEAQVSHCLYAGDDRTDVDAFDVLHAMQTNRDLETAACVGVVAVESPPEVRDHADLTVDSPEALLELLSALV